MVEANGDLPTLPPDGELLLVGREQEVASFQKILKDGQTLLVVLTGGPGFGKSSLLHKFRSLAEEAGWNTAPGTSLETLDVTELTTPEDFSTLLQSRIAVPTSKSFIERPIQPLLDASGQPLLLSIVENVRALAPILILIDGYFPTPEFADWFQNSFVRDVKRAGARILMVVSDRPEAATKISPIADQIITLGPLDEPSIRQHFEKLGLLVSPSMNEKEISAYVKAAHEDSELLGSLTRVLRLALPIET